MPPLSVKNAPAKSVLKAPVQMAAADTGLNEIEALRKENAALKSATGAGAPIAPGAAVKVDQSVIVSMAEENRKLKAMLDEKSGAPAAAPQEVAQLSERLKSLEKENKTLAQKLESSETNLALASTGPAVSEKDTQTIAQLRSENDRLVESLAALQTAAGDDTSADKALEEKLGALEKDNKALTQQLDTLLGENNDYAGKISSYESQVAALEKELADPVKKNAAQYAAMIEELKQQVASSQAENELLKVQEVGNADALKEQVTALKGEMDGIRAEKDALALKMESIQAQAGKIAALEDKTKAKEEEVADLRASLEQLKQENTSLKQASVDEKADGAEASLSLADAQDKLEKLTLENEGMRTELAGFETAQSDIAALKDANMELASLLGDASDLTEGQEAALAEQQQKIDELSLQMEEGGNKEVASLEEQIKTLGEENKALKEELGVAQIELISLKQDAGETVSKELEAALDKVPGQTKAEDAPAVTASSENAPADTLDITEGPAEDAGQPAELAGDLSVDAPLEPQAVAGEESPEEMAVADVESIPAEEPRPVAAVKKAPVPLFKPAHKAVMAAAKPAAEPAPAEVAKADPQSLAAVEPASGIISDDGRVDTESLLGLGAEDDSEAGLSEAQRQEKAMAREVGQPSPVAAPSLAASVDAPVMASVSPIETENLSTDLSGNDEDKEGGQGQVLARLSDDGKPAMVKEPVAHEEMLASSDNQPAPAAKAGFAPALPIEKILTAAHIPVDGTVKLLADMSGPNFYAYQWQSEGGLFGSAQQKPVHSDAEFDGMVQDYLTKTEQRCGGDFAIDPSSTQEAGGTRIDSYEIACVGGSASTDSSASLLFFKQGDTFTVVAHESPTAGMSTAMDYRDRLIESLKKS
jgi:septal ring factor EnvC (AmiA/AmiB activator)